MLLLGEKCFDHLVQVLICFCNSITLIGHFPKLELWANFRALVDLFGIQNKEHFVTWSFIVGGCKQDFIPMVLQSAQVVTLKSDIHDVIEVFDQLISFVGILQGVQNEPSHLTAIEKVASVLDVLGFNVFNALFVITMKLIGQRRVELVAQRIKITIILQVLNTQGTIDAT